jgi:hypothetical protein
MPVQIELFGVKRAASGFNKRGLLGVSLYNRRFSSQEDEIAARLIRDNTTTCLTRRLLYEAWPVSPPSPLTCDELGTDSWTELGILRRQCEPLGK